MFELFGYEGELMVILGIAAQGMLSYIICTFLRGESVS